MRRGGGGVGAIEPGLGRGGVGPEGEVVGIAEVVEVGGDLGEAVGLGVPAFENKEAALGVVGEVVHAGGEDAAVGGLGEKADAAKAGGRDSDVEIGGEVEGDGLVGAVNEFVRGELLGGER